MKLKKYVELDSDYKAYTEHSIYVSLTDFEFNQAWEIGKQIWKLSQSAQLTDYWGNKSNGASGDRLQCLGAIAECAVAKWLNLFWLGNYNSFKNPDLADIEVRLIGVESYGLRVRNSDADDRKVLGIVIPKGKEREPYRIAGWIQAKDAKRPEWEMNPYNGRPMFCVPQKYLLSPKELYNSINAPQQLQNLTND